MKGAKTAKKPTEHNLLTLIDSGYDADAEPADFSQSLEALLAEEEAIHAHTADIGKPCTWCGGIIDGIFDAKNKWGIVPTVGKLPHSGGPNFCCPKNENGQHDNVGGYHGWPKPSHDDHEAHVKGHLAFTKEPQNVTCSACGDLLAQPTTTSTGKVMYQSTKTGLFTCQVTNTYHDAVVVFPIVVHGKTAKGKTKWVPTVGEWVRRKSDVLMAGYVGQVQSVKFTKYGVLAVWVTGIRKPDGTLTGNGQEWHVDKCEPYLLNVKPAEPHLTHNEKWHLAWQQVCEKRLAGYGPGPWHTTVDQHPAKDCWVFRAVETISGQVLGTVKISGDTYAFAVGKPQMKAVLGLNWTV